jgi:type IV secretory pathway VirJ component
VVGVDSLRYFWTARTRRVCQRLVRIADYYASIGTASAWCWSVSQGADVLPAAYNHLQATRQDVPLLALIVLRREGQLRIPCQQLAGQGRRRPADRAGGGKDPAGQGAVFL